MENGYITPEGFKKDMLNAIRRMACENAALKYNIEFPDAEKAEFSEALRKLGHDFLAIKDSVNKLIRLSLNETEYLDEGDDWESVHADLKASLIDVYEQIGILNRSMKQGGISVPLAESSMDIVHGVNVFINGRIKQTSGGEVPEWLLKSNFSAGSNWNFKIQVVYYMAVMAMKTFFSMIDNARAVAPGIKASYHVVDLMRGLPQSVETSLKNSMLCKEVFKEASTEALDKQ